MEGRRIVIHGGFHKTGTTSAQKFIFDNGPLIWPHAATVLPGRTRARVARHAVRYSVGNAQPDLNRFRRGLAEVLGGLNLGKRAVLISDENLSGRMPGREGQAGYGGAPDLMAAMVRVIRRFMEKDADIHFVFTTRDPEDWLRSTWMHNLRTSRLTLNFENYAEIHSDTADFDLVIQDIRAAVAPYPVHTARIEALADNPEGPAAPLIQLLGIPTEKRMRMGGLTRANIGPDPALAPQLLDLNRSSLANDVLMERKAALLDSLSPKT
ncbi:hypothetical protein [Salibaculum griseiflavum]|uniref:Sulfotransferase family protein n=1 Tax=Salibaculum griseiflavum TaxID=1914409 RepID=A0A2V1PA34_9RHOB|nr:hypothetical protein [Salibaculum griseiflavum]PWG18610.1 hypothetical protein DFK10_01445 [Salibaculum griseiflavum]